MDLFGPVKVYVQGRERNTRSGLAALDSECWIMVTVCPTPRLVNMQVMERSLADGIISGVTRQLVSGHNQHGHVGRVINSVQESFNDCGLLTGRYTATTLQTLAKLVENNYNNLPLGYHHHET